MDLQKLIARMDQIEAKGMNEASDPAEYDHTPTQNHNQNIDSQPSVAEESHSVKYYTVSDIDESSMFKSGIARGLIQEFGYKLDEAEEFQFSPEQDTWLGKANRQDPYILARMPGPKPPFSYFKDPEDQAIAKRMNFGANNLNKIKNLVGAGTQGDASTFAAPAAAPAKMRGGDPAAATQTGAASNMAKDPAQTRSAATPAQAATPVPQKVDPDQADRDDAEQGAAMRANAAGGNSTSAATGVGNPGEEAAAELAKIKQNAGLPSTQGAEASAKFKAEKLARLKEITAKLQASASRAPGKGATAAAPESDAAKLKAALEKVPASDPISANAVPKTESRLSEAEKYAALRDKLLMIETRVDEGLWDAAVKYGGKAVDGVRGAYQAAKTGFSGAPVATGKLTKAGAPQMTSQSSKQFAKQLAKAPATQRAVYNTAKVVKDNPIKTGLGAAAVAGGTAYALSGKPEETPAVVPAVQTGTPTPRKENPHTDQGGTTPTPGATDVDDIKALTTEIDAIEKELMGDDGSAFQNDPEIQKAIADAKQAAGGASANQTFAPE